MLTSTFGCRSREACGHVAILVLLLSLSACDVKPRPQKEVVISAVLIDSLAHEYIGQLRNYSGKALILTELLKQSISIFLNHPSDEKLADARAGWLLAHAAHLANQSLIYNPEELATSLERIDAWPLQEGFLDSLDEYPTTGLINDLAVEISTQVLIAQHRITDPEEVCLGFHAIEFLLWERPVSDFLAVTEPSQTQRNAGFRTADLSSNRRRATLRIMIEILHHDVSDLVNAEEKWFEATFQERGKAERLKIIVSNLIRMLKVVSMEASVLKNNAKGHSHYSNSSWKDISTNFDLAFSLLAANGSLHELLAQIDVESVEQITQTLADVRETVRQLHNGDGSRDPDMLVMALGYVVSELDRFKANF